MAAFRGYAEDIELRAADHLVIHKTDGARVVVIEYEVNGTILARRPEGADRAVTAAP